MSLNNLVSSYEGTHIIMMSYTFSLILYMLIYSYLELVCYTVSMIYVFSSNNKYKKIWR